MWRPTAAIAPRKDRKLRVHSLMIGETVTFDLDEASPKARKHWSDYVRGVAWVLEGAGHRLAGADLMIDSTVPLGSGLSSSAALEVATGYALLSNSGLTVDLTKLACLPEGRERVRRHALRHHGSVHRLPWRRGPRSAHRLPQPRPRAGADRPGVRPGDLQHDGSSQTRGRRIQSAPARGLRGGRATAVGGAARASRRCAT